MSTKKFGDKLEELDLSHEEIDRLTKCMKDEKFRDLLREYAEEISDPENRKRYEEEIALLEKDRGMDVKFINPKPGHVLKTSINGNQKCFINICTNENLGQPRSRPSMQGNTRGMQWSIPHSVSQAREDVDKAGTKCMVYDVVFHPDTYYLLKKNERFKKMIHDTALDAVERQFGVELDKVNVRTPKMSFKGLPMSSVIRTPHPNGPPESKDSSSLENVDVRLRPPFPDDKLKPGNNTSSKNTAASVKKSKQTTNAQSHLQSKDATKNPNQNGLQNGEVPSQGTDSEKDYIEPEYSVMHRGHVDMQNYCIAPNVVQDTWPKELVINIDLPLLSAANCVNLEIFERHLHLDSVKPAKYKLDFELPYPVAENKGFAKFDKSRHRLTVTLEVLPAPPPPKLLPFTCPPLVNEVETTPKSNDQDSIKKGGKQDDATSAKCDEVHVNGTSRKVGIEESVAEFSEVTEKTAETVLTDTSVSKNNNTKKEKPKSDPAPSPKQPLFVEEGRRHHLEGSNWSDSDDLAESTSTVDVSTVLPLTKNSAFLIDMVMKYEGLIRRCPQYGFQQDEHYVIFIIDVPHIFEESLWYAVYHNMLQFCCLSECLDDDMVNSVFQLWVEFEDGFCIDPQRSRVDVSGNNAVFCLRKARSHHEWQVIRAGFDKDNLEIRRFSTSKNVSELYTLVFKHASDVKASPIGVCTVVREEKDLLIIELEAKDSQTKTPGKNILLNRRQKSACERAERKHGASHETVSSSAASVEKEPKHVQEKIQDSNSHNDGDSKKVSFTQDVKKNAVQKGLQEESGDHQVDSDDEEQSDERPQSRNPVEGVVTIGGDDGTKEVIMDHVTKSAVQLSTDSLIYELDDDI